MATKITTPELFNLSSNNTAATQLPVFTTSTRPTPTTSTVQVEYLVIGGGGAGGGWGGGGGAGGYLTNYGGSKTPLTSSANYAIVVGEGGVKQTVAATAANSGEDSSIIGTGISITATGGGAGGTKNGNTTEFLLKTVVQVVVLRQCEALQSVAQETRLLLRLAREIMVVTVQLRTQTFQVVVVVVALTQMVETAKVRLAALHMREEMVEMDLLVL